MAVVHHGLPIRPVPAIHLQAPAAPFQSPRVVLSPLGPRTQPGHQPPALPYACGCHPYRDQGTTIKGGDAAACRAGRAWLSIPLAKHHMAWLHGCWAMEEAKEVLGLPHGAARGMALGQEGTGRQQVGTSPFT